MRTNGTSFTADRCVKHEGQAAVGERRVSSVPWLIDFLLHLTDLFPAAPGSDFFGVSPFRFCLYHRFLYFRVSRAYISSVRTLDLCNYCPGLVYPTTFPLYHHLNDWNCRGDHQCTRSLLKKVWTGNIESNLYRLEKRFCFNKRTWIAYLKWWQAHGSFYCDSLQVAFLVYRWKNFCVCDHKNQDGWKELKII